MYPKVFRTAGIIQFAGVLIIILFGCNMVQAQSFIAPPKQEIDVQKFAEALFPQQSTVTNFTDLYESLYALYLNPLDLNKADKEAFRALYILSDAEADSILNYRKTNPFISVYELQAVPGLPESKVRQLIPFVTVAPVFNANDIKANIAALGSGSFVTRFGFSPDDKQGFLTHTRRDGSAYLPYAGKNMSMLTRFRYAVPGLFTVGFTAQQDAGEAFSFKPAKHQYGPDFLSGYAMLENRAVLKRLIIGDFRLQTGQGLLFSAGFNPGMGSLAVPAVRRSYLGIKPYNSQLEGGNFSGAAATVGRNGFELTILASRQYADAFIHNPDSADSPDIDPFFSNINTAGLHRTSTEIANRKTLAITSAGTHLQWQSANEDCQIGLSLLHSGFSSPLQPADTFNPNAPAGRYADNVSISFNKSLAALSFFSEQAFSRSDKNGSAGIYGIIASPSRNLDFSAAYRHYSPSYLGLYANGFGNAYNTRNENGAYMGFCYRPLARLTFNTFLDVWSRPYAPNFFTNARGTDFMFRLDYTRSRTSSYIFQYRLLDRDAYSRADSLASKRHYLLAGLEYSGGGLNAATKGQVIISAASNKAAGYSIIQEIESQKDGLNLKARLAWFYAMNYAVRQYSPEPGLQGLFSVPAYYGKGMRICVVATYKIGMRIEAGLQLNTTVNYAMGRPYNGTGYEHTNTPGSADYILQLRVNL